jgi:hypothetical protein
VKTAWGALLIAASLIACKEKPKSSRRAPPRAAEEPVTAQADPVAQQEDDLKWLQGTWQEDGVSSWLLFNPPGEVAELGGKPVGVKRKGRLAVHGKYVGVVFDTEELQLEASPDKRELATTDIRRIYRRGAPP